MNLEPCIHTHLLMHVPFKHNVHIALMRLSSVAVSQSRDQAARQDYAQMQALWCAMTLQSGYSQQHTAHDSCQELLHLHAVSTLPQAWETTQLYMLPLSIVCNFHSHRELHYMIYHAV